MFRDWLESVRARLPQLSEEERVRRRRRSNIVAGIQLILLGVGLPLGYLIVTLMMFSDPGPTGIALTVAGSLILIVLGVIAIWRNRRG